MEYKISQQTNKILEGLEMLDNACDLINEGIEDFNEEEKEKWYSVYSDARTAADNLLKSRIEDTIYIKHFTEI